MPQVPKISYASSDDPLFKMILIRSVEGLTGQRKIEQLYHTLRRERDQRAATKGFWGDALEKLEITLDYDEAQLVKIPQSGPVIFVANHPFGILDGLIMCHIAEKTRNEFKILLHSHLCREEEITPYILPIDFSETKEAALINIESKNRALAVLRAGGAIVIFPAGGIATTTKGPFGKATDLEWKLFTAKMIHMTQATVVPVYFPGQNGFIFQCASQVSWTLRLSLLMHEVKKKIGHTVQFIIGDPIPYQELAPIKAKKELLDHLRKVTYSLAPPERKKRPIRVPFKHKLPNFGGKGNV
ncbi:MAG: glycerol acyltransferase [Anaerolineales bacterium]|nr:glycerol acyltransferase [Anaerolineales bacterium]